MLGNTSVLANDAKPKNIDAQISPIYSKDLYGNEVPEDMDPDMSLLLNDKGRQLISTLVSKQNSINNMKTQELEKKLLSLQEEVKELLKAKEELTEKTQLLVQETNPFSRENGAIICSGTQL